MGEMSVAETFHNFTTNPEHLDFSNALAMKDKLMSILKSLTDYLKSQPNRDALPSYVFLDMLTILSRMSHALAASIRSESKLSEKTLSMIDLATESFRSLRNSCAGCKKNQEECLRMPGLYWTAATILNTLMGSHKSKPLQASEVQCLRCGVQFLGNAASGFDESKSLVWEASFTIIKSLLNSGDSTLANYTCMMVYTCLTPRHITDLIGSKEGVDIVSAVLSHLQDTEWGLYILEKLLYNPNFLEKTLKMSQHKDKILLIEFINQKLRALEERESGRNNSSQPHLEAKVAMGNIVFISTQFKTLGPQVISLTKQKDPEDKDTIYCSKLLESMCLATATQNHYQDLCNDADLFKCAIDLLQQMATLGKQDNVFAVLNKAADASQANQNHPLFGFKKDLIRLLGNMVYKNRQNQDRLRELGGIPLILDHTTIDSRNPFIQQWAVFCIRNLCENNVENQAVINNMKLEGISNKNSLLQELGINASLDGDRITIKHDARSPKANKR